jgi:hypothetical protein
MYILASLGPILTIQSLWQLRIHSPKLFLKFCHLKLSHCDTTVVTKWIIFRSKWHKNKNFTTSGFYTSDTSYYCPNCPNSNICALGIMRNVPAEAILWPVLIGVANHVFLVNTSVTLKWLIIETQESVVMSDMTQIHQPNTLNCKKWPIRSWGMAMPFSARTAQKKNAVTVTVTSIWLL